MPSATLPVLTSTAPLWVLHYIPLKRVSEAMYVSVACSESARSSLSGGLGVSNRWTALALDESLTSLVHFAAAL